MDYPLTLKKQKPPSGFLTNRTEAGEPLHESESLSIEKMDEGAKLSMFAN